MKLLCTFIFATTCSLAIFGQTPQKSNWTKTDELNFKSDCKRGLKDSGSGLTNEQQNEYCDCMFKKIKSKFPDKYAQQPPIEWMIKLAKECL